MQKCAKKCKKVQKSLICEKKVLSLHSETNKTRRNKTMKLSRIEEQIIEKTCKCFSAKENGSYRKIPTMGFTHLYLCSPDYGHSDHNKSILCTIKDNEQFCKKILKKYGL